ncbi:15676_t:CDS:2, partial [Funneliformis caledonium]
ASLRIRLPNTFRDDELEEEELEEEEETSSEKEESIILKATLVQQLTTRYLKSRIYYVAKSKHWWRNVLSSYDPVRFKKLLQMFLHHFQQLADLIRHYP